MGNPERRYTISEVRDITKVPVYTLRDWERRFPQLNPKRNRANRRYYLEKDIEIILRIKQLLWHEKMTAEGARRQLSQELRGEGRPRTRREAQALIDTIKNEVDAMLKLLDSD